MLTRFTAICGCDGTTRKSPDSEERGWNKAKNMKQQYHFGGNNDNSLEIVS